jgi:F-type H+-transporting ATPase subunit b
MKRPLPAWLRAIIAAVLAVLSTCLTLPAFAQEHGEHGEHAAQPGHAAPEHEGAGAEHGAAHAGGHHAIPDINWTDIFDKERPAFIALVVNFGILAAAYYMLGKKPVTEGLKRRRVSIGQDIEDARKMLEEAKDRAKKYQADLKNADTDAATAKEGLIAAGKGEVERMIADAEERGERMKRDAERLVEQERKQVAQDLQIETINIAMTHAQKLLERSVTPEDHTRLANELLAELQKKPAATRSIAPRSGGAL